MKILTVQRILIVAASFYGSVPVFAQGTTTFLSNLGQPPTGSLSVGSNSWLAAVFYTGANSGGYLLNSVQLGMADSSGNPSGFQVMIYTAKGSGDVTPASNLATLAGQSDPATAGVYAYAPSSGLTLSAGTAYFIVLADESAIATGAYEWNYTGSYSYNPTGGWQAPIGFGAIDNYQSSDGVNWSLLGGPPQFAITATPAPEPGTFGLLALGGMVIGMRRMVQNPKSKVQS